MTSEQNTSTSSLSQVEESVLNTNKSLNLVLNNLRDPIFVKDEECRLLFVNDSFCNLFNLSRNEIIGKTLAEKVPPNEREHFLSIDKQVLENGKENLCEETLTTGGAKTKNILTRKNRFVDHKGNKVLIGVIHDITELKISQEALQKSENHFRMMIEKTADALLLLDPINDKFNYYNPSAIKMLGFKNLKKVPQLNVSELSPPKQPDGSDSEEKAKDMVELAIQNGSHRFEWIHRSPYRKDFPVEVLLTPIKIREKN